MNTLCDDKPGRLMAPSRIELNAFVKARTPSNGRILAEFLTKRLHDPNWKCRLVC